MIVFLIVQIIQTSMERLVYNVLSIKNGMELNVLIDVQVIEYGILPPKLVYVQLVNRGMELFVLLVQMEEHGMLILKVVNAQFHQPGMELLVFYVQEEDSIIHQALHVNVH